MTSRLKVDSVRRELYGRNRGGSRSEVSIADEFVCSDRTIQGSTEEDSSLFGECDGGDRSSLFVEDYEAKSICTLSRLWISSCSNRLAAWCIHEGVHDLEVAVLSVQVEKVCRCGDDAERNIK